MPPLPASVFTNFNPGTEAELVFGDFDVRLLAIDLFAAGTVVFGDLCEKSVTVPKGSLLVEISYRHGKTS